jgi:nicotinamidase-related amidase
MHFLHQVENVRALGMKQALMIVDVQRSFTPPASLVAGITRLLPQMPSVATLERHVESRVPFQRQLRWHPSADDESLVTADRLFVKHGYLPPLAAIDHLHDLGVARVLVCGIQAETCVLAAGFALFDAGLHPTLIADLAVGSSLDPSGALGVRLWRHHFGEIIERYADLL